MAIVGTRKKANVDDYTHSKFAKVAREFSELAKEIQDTEYVHPFGEPTKTMMNENAVRTLKDYFIEGSYDPKFFDNDPEGLEQFKKDRGELFENDVQQIREYTAMGTINPVVTTSLPMHKLIMMQNVFNKGVIQSDVAVAPNFTIRMQFRYLVTPDGKKIDLVRNQDQITDAFYSVNPERSIELELPIDTSQLLAGSRIVEQCEGVLGRDNLTADSYISQIAIENKDFDSSQAESDTNQKYIWYNKKIEFTPTYGSNIPTVLNSGAIDLSSCPELSPTAEKVDYISGQRIGNEFIIFPKTGSIKKVRLTTKLDPSNGMLKECSATWDTSETFVRIDNANPMNVPISPEEVKDIDALYGINQLSMVMSIINDVLGNVKDDTIRRSLYKSYANLPESQRFWNYFDFAPREGYNLDAVNWRMSSFMDVFDTFVTDMLYVLNDQDVTVSVFGRPDIIRKLTPTTYDYDYKSEANIGPVAIEYNRRIFTSDNRCYNFVSSQKLGKTNDLCVILNPHNSNRIIYRVYDYMFYVSNEIRNSQNVTLPGVHAFERFKFFEYQPVQGRFRILNPSGRDESAKPSTKLQDLIDLNPNGVL